jgi:hypothetical protein
MLSWIKLIIFFVLLFLHFYLHFVVTFQSLCLKIIKITNYLLQRESTNHQSQLHMLTCYSLCFLFAVYISQQDVTDKL